MMSVSDHQMLQYDPLRRLLDEQGYDWEYEVQNRIPYAFICKTKSNHVDYTLLEQIYRSTGFRVTEIFASDIFGGIVIGFNR